MIRRKLKDILLVEDNPDDVELIRIGFDKAHLTNQVVVARDGEAALDLLIGERAQSFAFVMLDLKLPKIGGIEVLERLRADPQTLILPVVVLTSSSEQDDMIASYDNGANSYVRKPVAFNELTDAVAKVGLYWAVLNEAPDSAPLAARLPADDIGS